MRPSRFAHRDRAVAIIDTCDICGAHVDPVFGGSHREACRANHKRMIRRPEDESRYAATQFSQQRHAVSRSLNDDAVAPESPGDQPGNAEFEFASPVTTSTLLFADCASRADDVDQLENADDLTSSAVPDDVEDRECVVCLDAQRIFAFVPCGHLAVCGACAPALDSCPVCRQERRGLLHVDPNDALCVCKHCSHVIEPSVFDSHSETCALNIRLGHTKPRRVATRAACAQNCVRCRAARRDTALLPCGHRLFCAECAKGLEACPSCLRSVTSVLTTYEA